MEFGQNSCEKAAISSSNAGLDDPIPCSVSTREAFVEGNMNYYLVASVGYNKGGDIEKATHWIFCNPSATPSSDKDTSSSSSVSTPAGVKLPNQPGMILLGSSSSRSLRVVACPQFCLDVAYVTCPSSGNQQLPARCNCCMTPKGCTLHLSDGTSENC